jgi:hypothetical protein
MRAGVFRKLATGFQRPLRWRDAVFAALLLAVLFSIWSASEIRYRRSIAPTGIATVADYVARHGTPAAVQHVRREGRDYLELRGRMPEGFVLAFPSAPPSYIFDASGAFVTWCADPGDTPAFRRTWPVAEDAPAAFTEIRTRLGL